MKNLKKEPVTNTISTTAGVLYVDDNTPEYIKRIGNVDSVLIAAARYGLDASSEDKDTQDVLEAVEEVERPGTVAFLGSQDGSAIYLNREGAVAVRDYLNNAIQAYDGAQKAN